MISIISVVNNEDIFETYLKKSLEKQTGIIYELIKVDNTNHQYSCMVDALNEGIKKAKGDFIFVVHPDIALLDQYALRDIFTKVENTHAKDPHIAIWGLAGVSGDASYTLYSTLVHGKDRHQAGNHQIFKTQDAVAVTCVDACFFGFYKQTIIDHPFWDALTSWHLYIEELSLRLSLAHLSTVVIPGRAWHLSAGSSLDSSYYREAKKVIKKYPELPYFNTTSFHWEVNKGLPLKLSFYALRYDIHHKLRK